MTTVVGVGTRAVEGPEDAVGPRSRGAADRATDSRRPTVRAWHLDAIRGLAVALMVADHILLWHPQLHETRHTITRASMPLFFVLSGHLVRKPNWRWLAIFVVGLVLPVVVPFIDNPNVLCWYVLGATTIWLVRKYAGNSWLVLLIGIPLAKYANYFDVNPLGNSYQPDALLGLMALGALLPRGWFHWGQHLPKFLGWLGRFPLSVYVSHLLAIEAFVLLWRHVS